MTKIQMIVLDSVLKTGISKEALLSLIKVSGNEEVAVEILAGVYEQPVISFTSPKGYKPNRNAENICAQDFCPYKNEVSIEYQERESKWVYVPKSLTNFHLTKAEYDSCIGRKEEALTATGLTSEEFDALYTQKTVYGEILDKIKTDTTSLVNWQ